MARPYHTRALLLRFLAAMPDHPDEVARLAVDVQDWRELFGAAALHGVALVLVDALRHAGVTLPAALSRQLDELVAVQSLENELSLRALRNCVDALDKARIQVLPLKGPLLSERVYGSPFA
ncbi:MAG TPA: nucleotidyltransferase family protein, partial [Labilithrix sp.]|nr:nucleotidyltransferase family protein [Labilithrix sp.]